MPTSLAESPAHTQSDGGTPRVFCTYIAAAPVRGPREVAFLWWLGLMWGRGGRVTAVSRARVSDPSRRMSLFDV